MDFVFLREEEFDAGGGIGGAGREEGGEGEGVVGTDFVRVELILPYRGW